MVRREGEQKPKEEKKKKRRARSTPQVNLMPAMTGQRVECQVGWKR